jgi:hypothetical protein
MLHWHDCKPEYFADLEARYKTPEEHRLFAAAYSAMGEIAEGGNGDIDGLDMGPGFVDVFGDYYMEHFSNDHAGQFFTPEHMCDMMARLTHDTNDLKDGMTVHDPACGSGRCLMSMAKLNRRLKFYAADLDHTCVKMCLINFMLNSMAGEVVCMNSLSLEIFHAYKVTMIPHGTHLVPMYMKIPVQNSVMYHDMRVSRQEMNNPAPKEHKPFIKVTANPLAQQATLF